MMKKIFLFIVLTFVLNSCSNDKHEDEYVYNGEVLPVVSYVMPTTYAVDAVSTITLRYKIPTTCYGYDGIYYDKNGMTRTVGIATYQYSNGSNCQIDGVNVYEASLNFKPVLAGTYTFKFFTGKDSAGVDQFATETVVVP
jgi:hypothetical protein